MVDGKLKPFFGVQSSISGSIKNSDLKTVEFQGIGVVSLMDDP